MATEKDYYIGVGNAAVATLDANSVPGPYDKLGETVMVEFDIAAEYADNFSTSKNSPNVQDLHAKIKNGPVGVTVTCKEHAKRVLEFVLHGKTVATEAGSVSGEVMPSGFIAGQQYFTDKPNVDTDTVVIVDSAGSPSTLVPGTHYTVEESGAVTFKDIDAADAVKATATITLHNQPNADDQLIVGSKTYTFKVTATLATHIQIGDDIETTATNIANRINTDTAATGCTAVPHPTTVVLTVNTPGTAGNSKVLTTDGTRLSDTNFSGGDDADELVQPFLISYSYGASSSVGILDDDPAPVAFMFDGKNLNTRSSKKNLKARLKEVSFPPSSKFTLKAGSSGGTGNNVNEYEIKGVALDLDGSGYGTVQEW
jgi:hypothetical protein